jgi:hypothetical protein
LGDQKYSIRWVWLDITELIAAYWLTRNCQQAFLIIILHLILAQQFCFTFPRLLLRRIFGPKSIIRIIKARRMRWAGHVTQMGEKRKAYKLLVGTPEGKYV